MAIKNYLRKHWSTAAMLAFVVLLLIPQTSVPIKVAVNRLFSFSPSTEKVTDAAILKDYNWTLVSLDGSTANLNSSLQKVTLINLWATWCAPCIAEMPSLQALYDTYGDRVDFYFVSSESAEKVNAFMTKNEYSFPVYLQKFKAPTLLESNSLPTTYLIDKNGKIRIDETGAANWNSQKVKSLIDRLLID